MKTDEQRIAIAEACGWFPCRSSFPCGGFHLYGTDDKPGDGTVIDRPPDYLNDLNAMREAEMWLAVGVRNGVYKANLLDVTFRDPEKREGMFLATAAQRAEAFLRTIGKWTDGESEEKK